MCPGGIEDMLPNMGGHDCKVRLSVTEKKSQVRESGVVNMCPPAHPPPFDETWTPPKVDSLVSEVAASTKVNNGATGHSDHRPRWKSKPDPIPSPILPNENAETCWKKTPSPCYKSIYTEPSRRRASMASRSWASGADFKAAKSMLLI